MAATAFVNDARVMSKGQVTIPKNVRAALGIETGDRVTFIVDGTSVRVVNSAVYALMRFQEQMKDEAGKAGAALLKALTPPYQPLTCDYVVDELHRKFREKFPDRMTELEAFLYSALPVIPTPEEVQEAENMI